MELPAQPLTLDQLVARMRSELGREATTPEPIMGCDGAVALAEQNADIGAHPPLREWQGVLRPVAHSTATLVLYLARFITAAQTRFNCSVLAALRILDQGARRLDARSTVQAGLLTDRMLEVERVVWRLRADVARIDRRDAPATIDQPSDSQSLDDLYAALEDRFRGSRDEIKDRLRAYLPVVEAAGVDTSSQCIDLGCGRGEWLELLRERGWHAHGVDSNRAMIARCRALNLDVVHADAATFLRGVADASIAMVTMFHVVEHLPFPTLATVLDEAARVLRPGGVLLVETPNPDCPEVVRRDFYLDPTHRHPLPPELMSFLADAKGFDRIAIVPARSDQPALDYALVARRP